MSTGEPVYLDYNATAPIRPEALQAVAHALGIGANPSSIHAAGRRARSLIESSRETLATFVGASAGSLVFTSGGAEANALALRSARASGFGRILVSATEHDTVVESARALGETVLWPVDANGRADLDWLRDRLGKCPGLAVAALMLANNETGVIQPVAEAAALVRAAGGWLHVDAIQAAGKIDIDITALGAHSLSLSAHKIGGPQGVGALAVGAGASLSPDLHGGGQERGRRAGTENLAGIAGFAAAAIACADRAWIAATAPARAEAESRLEAAGATIVAKDASRLPNTLCLAVPAWPSELQVIALDLNGLMVSAGAACSSGKVRASRVLESMGLGALAGGALRASCGWASGPGDWARLAEVWTRLSVERATRALSVA